MLDLKNVIWRDNLLPQFHVKIDTINDECVDYTCLETNESHACGIDAFCASYTACGEIALDKEPKVS